MDRPLCIYQVRSEHPFILVREEEAPRIATLLASHGIGAHPCPPHHGVVRINLPRVAVESATTSLRQLIAANGNGGARAASGQASTGRPAERKNGDDRCALDVLLASVTGHCRLSR